MISLKNETKIRHSMQKKISNLSRSLPKFKCFNGVRTLIILLSCNRNGKLNIASPHGGEYYTLHVKTCLSSKSGFSKIPKI